MFRSIAIKVRNKKRIPTPFLQLIRKHNRKKGSTENSAKIINFIGIDPIPQKNLWTQFSNIIKGHVRK